MMDCTMDCTMPTLSPFLAWVSCQGTSPTHIDDENNNEAATAINERRAAYLRRDSSWSVDVLEIDPSSYAARLPPNTASAAVVKNYEDQVSELQRFYYKRRSVSQHQRQLQQAQQQHQAINKKCVRTATTTTNNDE
jgi:hypothetical protein